MKRAYFRWMNVVSVSVLFLIVSCGLSGLYAEDTQNTLILGGLQPSERHRESSQISPNFSTLQTTPDVQNTQTTPNVSNTPNNLHAVESGTSTTEIQRIPTVRSLPTARAPQEMSSANTAPNAAVSPSSLPVSSGSMEQRFAETSEPSISPPVSENSSVASPADVSIGKENTKNTENSPEGENTKNTDDTQNESPALPQTIFETIQSQPVQSMRSWLIEHLGESAWKGIERILSALLVFGVFWLIANWLRKLLELYGTHQDINPDIVETLAKIAKIGLWTVGGTTALGQFGIDVTPLITSLGITSLALGLAMKEVCSNAVAGLQILIYKPFRRYDRIQVQSFKGRVLEVNLRYTVLEQDGTTERVLLPNTLLLSNTLLVTAMEHQPRTHTPEVNPLQQVSDGIRRMLQRGGTTHAHTTRSTSPLSCDASQTAKSSQTNETTRPLSTFINTSDTNGTKHDAGTIDTNRK